ncbi:hypothetical protein [Curtobacterium herbarum]|uniref:Uncharacterized protein n=1 Tax=Curtobacterium herbarum TaxID=150122 RepID=A0ABN1ZAR0_9MICO|nr:hypothetical protein [Curtobacterium herbarum]MBM7475459.1 hypothetical protein [Curtobacterium herbarum]MCS6543375.1 hypothetical protein [Curtobacterium herbarum]
MSRTDDDAAARARLERIAWGAGASPAEAARARIALADLDREARTRPATAVTAAAGSRRGRRAGAASSVPEVESAAPVQPEESAQPVGPAVPVERAEPVHGAPDSRPDPVPGGGVEDGDQTPEASGAGGGGAGLLAGSRRVLGRTRVLLGRIRHTDRTVLWALGGAAVVIGLVAGTGVGLSIGTRTTAEPASAVTTPAAGTVTLEQMLDLPQTYADQLPGGIDAPVSLHTTRLVFTNRSLAGDDAATPWNVWAGVGRDTSTLCLVATADRLQGTSACYPRDDVLHGVVSLSATSLSGTLWIRVVGGAVRGTVTSSPPPLY